MNAFQSMPIVVCVMHDEPLIAAGLVAALDRQSGMQVAYASAEHARYVADTADVLVTDYRGGLALCLALGKDRPGTSSGRARILIVTDLDREHDIRLALDHGAHGYLLQRCALEDLIDAVKAVARGMRYMTEAVAHGLADSLLRQALTARETEVLRLLAAGQCNKSIARELDIASSTVKSHVKSILRKLPAVSRTEAVGLAADRGLLGVGTPRRTHAPEPRGALGDAAHA